MSGRSITCSSIHNSSSITTIIITITTTTTIIPVHGGAKTFHGLSLGGQDLLDIHAFTVIGPTQMVCNQVAIRAATALY